MKASPRQQNEKLVMPRASAAYRRRAWERFQLSLDPLAEPQKLRSPIAGLAWRP